jgi:alpha-tubulin suppressor-like RCC1 family protein
MPEITNYIENGVDLGTVLVDKAYLIEVYPQLVDWSKTSSLWLWGNNYSGQVGDNTNQNFYSSPVQTVAGGTNWKQICAADNVFAAIKTDGTLWTWGWNYSGRLGDGTNVAKSSPVQTVAGGTNWKQVSVGALNTIAIKTDGTLWVWGQNNVGQLGDGTTINQSSPVQTVSGGNNWKYISGGEGHYGAIKNDGTLWLWGYNYNGRLGDGTTVRKSSPVQTVAGGTNWKSVSCGGTHTAAIKMDGTLWMWGRNSYGQLGTESISSRSSPVQTITGGNNWKQVSCSGNSHTGAIKTDGTLWVWGYNYYGQLGDGTIVAKSSPVQTVAGGTNWKQVSIGETSSAIKTDGTLWTWVGDGFGTSPTQVISGNNWRSVSSGQFYGAIKEDGYF